MTKRMRIILVSVIIIFMLLICCMFIISQNKNRDKNAINDLENVFVESPTNIKDKNVLSEGTLVSKAPVEDNSVTTTGVVTSMESVITTITVASQGTVTSNMPTVSKEPLSSSVPIYSKEPTSSKEPIYSKEAIKSKEPTDSNYPIVTDETIITQKPIITKKPTPSRKPIETEKPNDDELNIELTIPENVMVNVSFDVSIETSNCAHVEWYINGEYKADLEKKINPKGTLYFSKNGIYRITVIGYTQDWKKNVSDSKAIQVYSDPSQLEGNAKEHDRAMYSWGHDYIYPKNEDILQKVMELTECNILYQEVAYNAPASEVAAFLKRRGEHNQIVYYLCGNASWGIEKDAASMLKQVERVVSYNKSAGNYKFVGIQFDVEPYCLDDFEANADKYMAQYVKNCKLAYAAAHKEGLLVEVCIPYWWESSYGYQEELEDIIANACDSIAVMNYYKKQTEAEHIETEVELCRKYNKRIINVTEMQAPGLHGLTENNTYYNDGIDAVEEMWNSLDAFFQYEDLGYSYHYLDVLIELLALG